MGVFRVDGAGEQISPMSCDSMLITYFPPQTKIWLVFNSEERNGLETLGIFLNNNFYNLWVALLLLNVCRLRHWTGKWWEMVMKKTRTNLNRQFVITTRDIYASSTSTPNLWGRGCRHKSTHTYPKKKSNCPNTKYRNNIVRLVARIAWNGINMG